MRPDAELLRQYAVMRDDDAFGELVRRHLNLVYRAALRQLDGDVHGAEEAAQAVFTLLARKASALVRHPSLSGWLYTTTHFCVRRLRRDERRRQAREREAHLMHEISSDSANAAEWERLRPVLDDAIQQLGERERDALLARFFEGKSFAEVGAKISSTEDAARMRVERALEKLRALLARRGVTSTGAAIGLLLANEAACAVPASFAASVAGAALTGAAASGATSASALAFMSMSKVQIGVIGAVAAAVVGSLAVQENRNTHLRNELAALRAQHRPVAEIAAENIVLAKKASDVANLRTTAAEWESLQRGIDNMRTAMQEMEAIGSRRRRAEVLEEIASRPLLEYVFTPNEVDVPARPMRPFRPFAWLRGESPGEIVVGATIDAQGNVRHAEVLRSTVNSQDASALSKVKTWDFLPAMKAGKAVNSRIEVILQVGPTQRDGAPRLRHEKTNWF